MSYPGRYYPGQVYPSQTTTLALNSDSAVLNESSSLYVTRSTSDTASGSESLSGATSGVRSDTSALSEQSNNLASNTSSDTASLIESNSIFQGMLIIGTDLAVFTEQCSLYVTQSRTDIASSTDLQQESASFFGNDLYSINDQIISQNICTSELFGFYEDIPPRQNFIYTSNIFNFFESLSGNFQIQLFDTAELIEQGHITELEVNREDPFGYPNYEHRNDLRVIAQDHFTREIIHWDLPVDNVTLTFTLSGPNLFSAKITSEMESLYSLSPPLTPDRTWLHVEEFGQIVASFIMTPIIEDLTTQSRTIEGEGFSAYPHWVVYEGASYVGIQVDPGIIIKKIWEHVQSFPDGNLNVKANGTTTPLRIGYPSEGVDYQTVTGIDVDANNGGPYLLNFWSAQNCGEEIEKLCKENSIEFYERSSWNMYHTDVEHEIVFGYPRVGKKNGIVIREGENLYQIIPSYQENNDSYASDVLVIGAGTGPGAIRAKASGRIGRLRKTKVIQNQNIARDIQAQEIARFEFTRLNESRFLIENVVLDLTHPNSTLGSFQAGDDIYLQCNVPYVGYVQRWYRITSYQYDIYNKTAALSLDPSESFSYGQDRVSPTSYLPSSGFAMVSHHPLPRSTLIAYQQANNMQNVEAVGEFTDDPLEAYKADAVWYVCREHNIGAGIPYGMAGVYEVQGLNVPWKFIPIENLNDGNYTLVIARTEEGQYFCGDNVFFMDSRGNFFGQRPDKTTQLETPLILSWCAAYANKLIQVWQTAPQTITPGLKFPGSDNVPGAIQGPYNNYIIAKVYYGWGGTYTANGPGPELFGIMTALATGVIYPY